MEEVQLLPPHLTAAYYAESHDAAVARCLATLLEHEAAPLPHQSLSTAQLAQRFGGLGLRSATSDRFAAHWASWCDALPVIHVRAPAAAARLLGALQGDRVLPCAAAAALAQTHLRALGRETLDWAAVHTGSAAAPPHRDGEASRDPWPFKGWQRFASRACDAGAFETHLTNLTPASRVLLLSEAGPFAARALNVLPTRDEISIPSAQFRVHLLRRLRLPLRCHGEA